MATPGITLTATLQDLSGVPVGSAANPSKMVVALCGFGPYLPAIAGTSMLVKVGPIYVESSNGAFSFKLWGNDAITPAGTYYTVSLIDGQGNVVQCAAYQLTGAGNLDLSNLAPILPPYGFAISQLEYQPCVNSGDNIHFTSPSALVIGVTYNGVLMQPGLAFPPSVSYTLSGTTITMNTTLDPGDRIDVLAIF